RESGEWGGSGRGSGSDDVEGADVVKVSDRHRKRAAGQGVILRGLECPVARPQEHAQRAASPDVASIFGDCYEVGDASAGEIPHCHGAGAGKTAADRIANRSEKARQAAILQRLDGQRWGSLSRRPSRPAAIALRGTE